MPTHTFEYSVIRVVPWVERQEFLNVGILLSCPSHAFLEARVELDEQRVKGFAPTCDTKLLQGHLDAIKRVCEGGCTSGPIGQLPQRARFHWLVAPRSTIVQFSPVHSGLCKEPNAAIERLTDRMVRPIVSK